MSEIELFDFAGSQVRVAVIAGEPWFVLADLCRVLGLGNAAMVGRRLDDDEKGVSQIDTPGGRQSVTVVSESGMYEVVIRSDKPEAKAFRRWITADVLPQIRKTGTYGRSTFDPMSLEGASALIQAAQTALTALAIVQPKADAWEQLAEATGDYSVAEAAKMLARAGVATGPQRLFESLSELGWLFRRGGKWVAYQERIDAGWLAHRAQSHHHPRTGELIMDPPQVRVTVRGLERLRNLLGATQHELLGLESLEERK